MFASAYLTDSVNAGGAGRLRMRTPLPGPFVRLGPPPPRQGIDGLQLGVMGPQVRHRPVELCLRQRWGLGGVVGVGVGVERWDVCRGRLRVRPRVLGAFLADLRQHNNDGYLGKRAQFPGTF